MTLIAKRCKFYMHRFLLHIPHVLSVCGNTWGAGEFTIYPVNIKVKIKICTNIYMIVVTVKYFDKKEAFERSKGGKYCT